MNAPAGGGHDAEAFEAAISRLIAVAGSARRRQAQLQHALDTRIVIEQAKGVLAERSGLDMQTAFEELRRSARGSRRRIHDVAREVVSDVGRRG